MFYNSSSKKSNNKENTLPTLNDRITLFSPKSGENSTAEIYFPKKTQIKLSTNVSDRASKIEEMIRKSSKSPEFKSRNNNNNKDNNSPRIGNYVTVKKLM